MARLRYLVRWRCGRPARAGIRRHLPQPRSDFAAQDAAPPGGRTLAFFAYPLAASLLIQLPGLSSTALGIGQAILAAGLIGLAAAIDVPRWRQERGNPLSWRLSHFAPTIVIILLAIVGAAATITTSIGGL